VNRGEMTPAQFRRAMENTIRSSYARAYQYGANLEAGGRPGLSAHDLAVIRDYVGDEFRYLSGFYHGLHDAMRSPPQGRPRAVHYGKAIRGLWHEGRRSIISADRDDGGQPRQLVEFVSRGSATTCQGCLTAQAGGPYDPDEAPVPGAPTCYGLDRCHCHWRL